MSESCNGGSVQDGNLSESAGGPVETRISVRDDEKKFPPVSVFHGFVKTPCVWVTRYDITPFLNGSRKTYIAPINGKTGKVKSILKNNEYSHQKRLSQKCFVNLTRDDLEKLKDSYSKSWKPALKVTLDSDSEDSHCSDNEMASKCKICNKSYNSERKLLTHQRKKHIIYTNSKPMKHVSFSDHVIIHEVKEYHKCRKCPKIFEDYRSLKLHTKQEHKKRKCYICYYCNKNFAERMIFKIHIKLHCDVCGKLFPNKAKCVSHKRNICRILKLHKCKICNESFYSYMGLKDHSYDHNSSCLVCNVCKDQFESKCTIAHHLSFLHSKRRPRSMYTMRKMGNERLYLCNFCEKSSVELNVLERHVEQLPDLKNRAIMGHSYHYFCDVCKKTFATEQGMLQHKWTHFLKITDKQMPCNVLKDMKITETNPQQNSLLKDLAEPKPQQNSILKYLAEPKPQQNCILTDLAEPNSRQNSILTDLAEPNPRQNSILKDMLAKSQMLPKPQIKTTYNVNEKLPLHFQPKLILKKLDLDEGSMRPLEFIDITIEMLNGTFPQDLKKAIVDPKSKKTLISKHQCEICGKYFSTNYCLNRHITTQHVDYENLRCRVCEETFVWPSLLRSHKCIRLYHPEMPFDDARPEIYFDNLHGTGLEDLNISDNDDYMSTIDFEIPAPIVELTEGETFLSFNPDQNKVMNQVIQEKNCQLQSLGYKLVMQEVPIEF